MVCNLSGNVNFYNINKKTIKKTLIGSRISDFFFLMVHNCINEFQKVKTCVPHHLIPGLDSTRK